MLSVGVVMLAALGTLTGVLVAVLSGAPNDGVAVRGQSGLPDVRPSTGDAPVITGVPLTLGAGAQLLPGSSVPAVRAATRRSAVGPLRRTIQADLLVSRQPRPGRVAGRSHRVIHTA